MGNESQFEMNVVESECGEMECGGMECIGMEFGLEL